MISRLNCLLPTQQMFMHKNSHTWVILTTRSVRLTLREHNNSALFCDISEVSTNMGLIPDEGLAPLVLQGPHRHCVALSVRYQPVSFMGRDTNMCTVVVSRFRTFATFGRKHAMRCAAVTHAGAQHRAYRSSDNHPEQMPSQVRAGKSVGRRSGSNGVLHGTDDRNIRA
jgi:hypothetical protein